MPLLLPKQRSTQRETNFTGRPATTWGTTVTSDTVAHTLPATYTQLIASTSFDTDWVNIWFHTNQASNTDSDSLVNIYAGAGGAEQIVIEGLLAGWARSGASSPPAPKAYGFPLHIPAGTRLSARHQSVRTSTATTCMIELLGGAQGTHWAGTRVEAVGANTSTSGGVFVTPGTTAEGTLTSIGTNTYEWGFIQPMVNGNTDTTMNAILISCDIARGSATTDLVDGLDDFMFWLSSNEESGPFTGLTGRFSHMPASSTLYLRSQGSAAVEAGDWVIYGVA